MRSWWSWLRSLGPWLLAVAALIYAAVTGRQRQRLFSQILLKETKRDHQKRLADSAAARASEQATLVAADKELEKEQKARIELGRLEVEIRELRKHLEEPATDGERARRFNRRRSRAGRRER